MLTRLLVAVNVLAYLYEQVAGMDRVEQRFGLVGMWVMQGQWYRVYTSAFMHASIMHIAFNMFALWQVGGLVERFYGTPRMALIYLVSIIGGSYAVVYLQPDVLTVGASGAIFGLFGALAIACFRFGKAGRELLQQTTGIIVVNLLIGFFPGSNVSVAAHVGGLVAGTIFGLVLFRMPRQLTAAQTAAAAPEATPYARRIDPYADRAIETIEHEPIEHSHPQSPPA